MRSLKRSSFRIKKIGQAIFNKRNLLKYKFTAGNVVKLLFSGAEYFSALIDRINIATRDIVLETYIFRYDIVGKQISNAFLNAAKRGVQVRIITDGIGTEFLPLFGIWNAAGIRHQIYNPYLFGYFGFSRTHRKLACIDNNFAYCGGINIMDDFDDNGTKLLYPRWDFSVELQGPVVYEVKESFELQWQRIKNKKFSFSYYFNKKKISLFNIKKYSNNKEIQDIQKKNTPGVAFIVRDNFMNRRTIEKAYLTAIGQARKEILLANPYFMPGRKLLRSLICAAKRGIDVRLLIGKKEFVILDYASPFLYRSLLISGVKIAEFNKTMLHAKVAVIDSRWATIGSSNLDPLSFKLNNEANILLILNQEINKLRSAILTAFNESKLIEYDNYKSRPITERVLNYIAYNIYRFIMKLLTI